MADWDWRNEDGQEENGAKKEKKYVTRGQFFACFLVLLAAILWQGTITRGRVEVENTQLHNAITTAEDRISGTISSIPYNIEKGITEANHPLHEGTAEIADVNLDTKTVRLHMEAEPKEYTEGMAVTFFVTCDDGEVQKAAATSASDRTFIAETEIPFCDVAEVKAAVRRGDTEYIQYINTLYINENVQPFFDGWYGGTIHFGNGVHRFQGNAELYVDTPEWGGFTLKNVTAMVQIDGKTIQTVPMTSIEESAHTKRYTAAFEEFKLRTGEKLTILCKAEDENGRKYTYIIEEGEALKNDYLETEPAAVLENGAPRLTIE